MTPHPDSGRDARRWVRTLRWALLATLVVGTTTITPRPARAQMPIAAQVVASVARWMVKWLGEYLLGRGVDFALERTRGQSFRRQLEQVERTLRRQIESNAPGRARLSRELRLVQSQIRTIDAVTNPAFSRDSARVYYGRVNSDIDELRDVVQAVTVSMDTAWATIDAMRREIEDLRDEIADLRGRRRVSSDDGEVAQQGELPSIHSLGLPDGLRLGLGYVAGLSQFTVPGYGAISASSLNRGQQGATVRVAMGGVLQLGVTASALGAWMDSASRSPRSSASADRQPLQTVTLGADLSLALAPRGFFRPLIGGAAEQVWMSFRNLPGVASNDVVFSGLVYGPQAGIDLKLVSGFSIQMLARSMTGKLHVPVQQLQGLRDTRGFTSLRRHQITAILSYTEGQ